MYNIVLGRSQSDLKKYGKKGSVLIGKQYVEMGQTSSLSNPIYLDVARAHAMLICGKRGCLSEDAKIYTDKGYKKIIDFDEKKDKVLSFNKKKIEFEWEKARFLEYNISPTEEMYEIVLQDGQILKLTSEHPLLVYRQNKIQWIIAEDIKKSDLIVSIKQIKCSTNFKNKKSLRMARLLGFLLADGNLYIRKREFVDSKGYKYNGTRARLRIINSEDGILKQAKKDLDLEFKVNSRIYKKGKDNCYIVEICRQDIVNKFIKLDCHIGKKDKLISIPQIVWESNLRFKKEFLKALFSCDGYVSKNASRINYYSNSKQILLDLNLILGEFGIHSRVRDKNVKCNGKKFLSYELDISDYDSVMKFQEIGFYQNEKNERLKQRKFNQVKNRKGTIYLDGNIFCQKIKSIEIIKNIKKVYDLRVSKNHSFIANGIISHNSGKSYTLGAVAEGLADIDPDISKNLSFMLLDTMGVYWSMKYPNQKDDSLLKKWGLEGKGLDVVIYVPGGFYEKYKADGIPVDFPFYIKPNELSVEDWMNTFKLKTDDITGVAVQRVINNLLKSGKNFTIDDIIEKTQNDERLDEKTKLAVINRFEICKTWGLFSNKATPIRDIFAPGKVVVMDLSPYVSMPGGWEVKALALGIIAKKIFIERMLIRKNEEKSDIINKTQVVKQKEIKDDIPMPWLIIDECHEFLPETGETPATKALMTILREGRQPGVSLIMATQQPGKIHTDAITQSDVVLSHRITASFDLEALDKIFLSYDSKGSKNLFNSMPRVKGCAIIMDDKNERLHTMQVKPRFTWHGGEDPNAIREIKDEYDF